jgi:hypothetical protein
MLRDRQASMPIVIEWVPPAPEPVFLYYDENGVPVFIDEADIGPRSIDEWDLDYAGLEVVAG